MGISIKTASSKPGPQKAGTSEGLANALFTKVQQRVLGVLFGTPSRSFYANEIIALAGSGTGAVQRELSKLALAGLVTVRHQGNQKHYQANQTSPIFNELRGLVVKTFGLADVLRAALLPLATQIRFAFIYGSVAKNQDTASSDIDLMVISDSLAYADIFTAVEQASQHLGRTVNPTVYTSQAFAQRVEQGSAFVTRVLEQPQIWLIGDEHGFTT